MRTPENVIPYERLELGGEPQAGKPALEMPMVEDRLSLVPKETPNVGSPVEAAKPILTDTTGAKSMEVAAQERFVQEQAP